MRYQIALCVALVLVAFVPAEAVVDRYLLASGPLVKPILRQYANNVLVVVAQTTSGQGQAELVVASTTNPRTAWQLARVPLPPSQQVGNDFDAVVTSFKPLRLCYAAALNAPGRWVPAWVWDGSGTWRQGDSGEPVNEASYRGMRSLAMGDASGNVLYAAGEEHAPRLYGQIWLSTDGGRRWFELCRGGALKPPGEPPATRIHQPLQPGLGNAPGLGLPPGNVIGTPVPWCTSAALCDTALGMGGAGPIWGRFGRDRALRIERGRPPVLSPPFPRAFKILWVSAPRPQVVGACWIEEAPNGPRHLSWTTDGGATWTHQSLEAGRPPWGIPFAGDCFVDAYTTVSTCVAAEVANAAGDKSWSLYWRTHAMGANAAWKVEALPGYNILGLETIADGQAVMLARTWEPNQLYCLHWQAPKPVVAPTLSWVGTAPYQTAGANPATASKTAGQFEFRVVYKHAENKLPAKVQLEFRNNPTLLAMKELSRLGPTVAQGIVYSVVVPAKNLAVGRTEYRFQASDGTSAATGAPTQWDAARVVTVTP